MGDRRLCKACSGLWRKAGTSAIACIGNRNDASNSRLKPSMLTVSHLCKDVGLRTLDFKTMP